MDGPKQAVVTRTDFGALFAALQGHGYDVVGPTLRDGAIVYDRLGGADELPAGWRDEQQGGHYTLKRRADAALFGHAVGPQSWKKYLHPPVVTLFKARRAGAGFTLDDGEPDNPPRPTALFGVRPCELAAIQVQDRVFLGGAHVDPIYAARRAAVFIVAVNCTAPGGTCFCTSLDTGPEARDGYDLLLTELVSGGGHRFVLRAGSARGAAIAALVPQRAADKADRDAARAALDAARGRMGRTLDTHGLPELMRRHYADPRWDDVGRRCLTCTNCTMACPTCFCTTVEDVTSLDGHAAERRRRWDSCFTLEFSYIHGGSVRTSPGARYRQWITHKLGTWHEQFGASGCVGCGRCITWCPVGIDITAEVRALRGRTQEG